jgi:hypothetical protein
MLAQTAQQLKPGDEFTMNDGAHWHTVEDRFFADFGHRRVVLLIVDGGSQVWMWADQEIVVRI